MASYPENCGDSDHGREMDLLSSLTGSTPASPPIGESSEISLQLRLLHDPCWKIKKELAKSDLGTNCRLVIPTGGAMEHIMSFMDNEQKEAVESEGGMAVTMVDLDTYTEHEVVFRYWSSQGQRLFIIRKGWTTHFVKRRDLKEKDVVGLGWDKSLKKFTFCVLK